MNGTICSDAYTDTRINDSFEDIYTFDGEVYISYRNKAKVMALQNADDEWKKVIVEAFDSSFVRLSHLYATVVAYSEAAHPKRIWDSELHSVIDEVCLRQRSFQQELQIEDIVL